MLIAWLLVTFGVTIVITKSRIGAPLRRRFPLAPPPGPDDTRGHPYRDGPGPDDKVVDIAHLLRCPMCTGWWVGAFLSPLHIRMVECPAWVPSTTMVEVVAQHVGLAVLNGFAAATWCWAFWVVLAALGAERQ